MSFKKIIYAVIDKILQTRSMSFEKKKIKDKKRQKIVKKYLLTNDQKKQIDYFYLKNYGRKIPYDWHSEYAAFTGKFDYKFIPELLFIPKIERMYNNKAISEAFSDKTLLPILVNGLTYVSTPKIYASATNIFNYKYENQLCSLDILIEKVSNLGKCFIKPAKDTNSGVGCKILNLVNGVDLNTNRKIDEIIMTYNNNFLIEELIKNSPEIKRLHPDSLNTFRIITYMLENNINVAPISMRIGQGRNVVDNAHAGGIFINVNLVDDFGELDEFAFTEFMDKFSNHPTTNISFKGYKIPQLKKVVDAAKKLHEERLSNFGMLSFDFVIDELYNPVLIEINSIGQSCWFPQMASGKAFFGDNTDKILQLIKKR